MLHFAFAFLPSQFLNQAHAWFLEIAFVREVSMHVCVDVCVEAMNN